MHGPIRDRLEDLLAASDAPAVLAEQALGKHLVECAECSSELAAMKEQSELFTTLRVPDTDPGAGFYARVLQRIEDSEIASFWSFFVDSRFSKRLAFASLTIAVALGTYVITEESHEHLQTYAFNGAPVHYDAPVMGNQTQQRDAVLENIAEHLTPSSQGQIQ